MLGGLVKDEHRRVLWPLLCRNLMVDATAPLSEIPILPQNSSAAVACSSENNVRVSTAFFSTVTVVIVFYSEISFR